MHHMTREEIKSLVKEVKNPRWKLMLLVGFWHGLRVSELTSLTASAARDGFIDVQRLKGSLRTIQPFIHHDDPELSEAEGLRDLIKTLKPADRLFPITRQGVWKLIREAGTRAGIPQHKLHPHILKHSIATQSIHEAGIENVRQWLGHRSISSTGEYLRVSDEAAARAVGSAMGVSIR